MNRAQAWFWGKEWNKRKVFWHPNSCTLIKSCAKIFCFNEWWKNSILLYPSFDSLDSMFNFFLGSFPYHMYARHCTTLELPTSAVYWYDHPTKRAALLIITQAYIFALSWKISQKAYACLLLLFWKPAKCGGTLKDVSNVILSPGFPGNYPGNLDCTWRILLPIGYGEQTNLSLNLNQIPKHIH